MVQRRPKGGFSTRIGKVYSSSMQNILQCTWHFRTRLKSGFSWRARGERCTTATRLPVQTKRTRHIFPRNPYRLEFDLSHQVLVSLSIARCGSLCRALDRTFGQLFDFTGPWRRWLLQVASVAIDPEEQTVICTCRWQELLIREWSHKANTMNHSKCETRREQLSQAGHHDCEDRRPSWLEEKLA